MDRTDGRNTADGRYTLTQLRPGFPPEMGATNSRERRVYSQKTDALPAYGKCGSGAP